MNYHFLCINNVDSSTVELTIGGEEWSEGWLFVTLFEPQLVVVEQRGHDEDTPAPSRVSDTKHRSRASAS